jgi:hypothetical protein
VQYVNSDEQPAPRYNRRVELGERRNQAGRRLAFVSGEHRDLEKKLCIGEMRRQPQVVGHASLIASQFLPLEDRPRRDIHTRAQGSPAVPHDERAPRLLAPRRGYLRAS